MRLGFFLHISSYFAAAAHFHKHSHTYTRTNNGLVDRVKSATAEMCVEKCWKHANTFDS